jgi:hypothetical protein
VLVAVLLEECIVDASRCGGVHRLTVKGLSSALEAVGG